MLGVYNVYSVTSGDLSLPYDLGNHTCDTLIIDVSTGIGLIDPETVSIYPNPVSTDIHLDVSIGFDIDVFDVQILDVNGSIVFQSTIDSLNMTVPVSSIGSQGLYLLQILNSSSGNLIGSKQLIIN